MAGIKAHPALARRRTGTSAKMLRPAVCVLVGVLAAGCYEPAGKPVIVGDIWSMRPAAALDYRIIGRSVRGEPIEAWVLGSGPETVLFLAAIHGDEPTGALLLDCFREYLLKHSYLVYGRQVVMVPVANPDGVTAGTRGNARGVDLNRNFTAPGTGLASEPESRVLSELIRDCKPARIVSIHESLACIDYDGPAWRLASAMAARCDLPVHKLGAKSVSLGRYAGLELGIPTITLELSPLDATLGAEELWNRYGEMLVTAVAYPGSK
jgi:protein MpaA